MKDDTAAQNVEGHLDLPPAAPDRSPVSEAVGSSAKFDQAFDGAFSLVAFAMNRHLIDHMMRALRELDVDFDSLIIWGILSHLNVMHWIPPGSSPATVLNEYGRMLGSSPGLRPLRLRDLEQVTRLPRETVRRKLLKLEKQGYVERHGDGWVFSREKIEPQLREFTRIATRNLLAVADEIRAHLKDAERRLGQDHPVSQ